MPISCARKIGVYTRFTRRRVFARRVLVFSTQERQQIGALALDLRWRAGMVKSYDFRQRRLELLSRLGVFVVQRRRTDLPACGEIGADTRLIRWAKAARWAAQPAAAAAMTIQQVDSWVDMAELPLPRR